MTTETQTQNFTADVARLLDIVAHALYSKRDVFLRELVSNASDACDRLRYEALKNTALTGGHGALCIRITKDPESRFLTVLDNGIGMSREDLAENLGTIAKSGTRALMEQVNTAESAKDKLSLIGQFGVGFYASFMVAHKVRVISRRAGETQTWHWESDGRTGFSIREATPEEAGVLRDGRGTAVMLEIKGEASEFLIEEMLKKVVLEYSDHVGFPIYIGENATPVNKASALWTRPKSDVTNEQYTEFYHHIGHAMDEPLMTSHWRAEGKMEYTGLLFVPTLRPWDLYDPSRKHAVRLYVRRIFITDQCDGLIYPWLRFLRGVIDSEDLPLNISREMLQHNPVIGKIRNGVATKILADLDKLSQDNPVAFATFWGQFGAALKEGLYDAPDHRDALLKVTRFYSTHKGNELTSLADYVSRMPAEQKGIYYISGENIETLKNSPQIEGFRARGLEVLFFTDTIDDFWLQSVPDFDGKPFKSVTKGNIDLSSFEQKDKNPTDKQEAANTNAAMEKLRDTIQEALKDDIGEVRLSSRLTDSAVCLVAAENEVDLRMERVLRIHQKYDAKSKRVLEINPDHPLIKRLSTLNNTNDLNEAAHLLLDQARIIQGEPVPDPGRFARALSRFLERGLAA